MRRFLFSSATILALTVTGCVTYQTPAMRYGGPGPAYGAPHPVVVVAEPAFMAFIPGLQIYFVPDISAEIFFYDGRWYNHIGARWYWGISYRGPWNFAEVRVVPAPLRKLPRDYRTRFRSGRYRVPYEHWKERAWETPPPDHHRMPSFLYRVPGPNVYVVPGVSAEIVFYNGGCTTASRAYGTRVPAALGRGTSSVRARSPENFGSCLRITARGPKSTSGFPMTSGRKNTKRGRESAKTTRMIKREFESLKLQA